MTATITTVTHQSEEIFFDENPEFVDGQVLISSSPARLTVARDASRACVWRPVMGHLPGIAMPMHMPYD